MSTVTIEEASVGLTELINHLAPGEEVVITQDNLPVARLLPVETARERQLGTLPGTVLYMAPDFDGPRDPCPETDAVVAKINQPVVEAITSDSSGPCRFGALQGTVLYMAPDFDAPLEDFREYME